VAGAIASAAHDTGCPVEIPEEEVESALDNVMRNIMYYLKRFVMGYCNAGISRLAQHLQFMPITSYRMEPFHEPGRVGIRMVLEVYLDDEQVEDLRRKVVREVCRRRVETVRKARAARMVKELLGRGESYVRGAENTGPGEGGEGAGGGGAEDGAPQGGHSAEGARQGA
jgi:hypothetical protein